MLEILSFTVLCYPFQSGERRPKGPVLILSTVYIQSTDVVESVIQNLLPLTSKEGSAVTTPEAGSFGETSLNGIAGG